MNIWFKRNNYHQLSLEYGDVKKIEFIKILLNLRKG